MFLFAAIWMDPENIILSHTGKTNIIGHFSYIWKLDNNTSESIYRAGTDSQTQKTNLGLPQWKGLGEG